MRRSALAGLLLLAACADPRRELERAVRAYDDELVKAYLTADPSRLDQVASQEEAGRIRVLIDLKTSARLVLESRLDAFEVTGATVRGAEGTVETRERWRYHDRHLRPGEPPGPELLSAMAMRYRLARVGGAWKVVSVATLSSEYLPVAAP